MHQPVTAPHRHGTCMLLALAAMALLLGAEGTGLPGEVLARGDLQVRIPMVGTAESLNLAVAAGLLLYEAQRGGGLDPA